MAYRVLDERRPVRNAGHAQARLVQHLRRIVRLQHGYRVGMVRDSDLERLRDRVGGDVVVSGSDPAGGEHVAVPGARLVDRLHDHRLVVGKDPRLAELDPELREAAGQVVEIAIRGPAGQHLVADHQHAGVHFAAHRPSVSLPGSTKTIRARAGRRECYPCTSATPPSSRIRTTPSPTTRSTGTSSGSRSSPSRSVSSRSGRSSTTSPTTRCARTSSSS